MNHLAVYTAVQANTAVPAQLAGIFDGYLSLQNSNYLLPVPLRWAGGVGIGATLGRVRANSPTLRTFSLPELSPVNVAAAPASLFPIPLFPTNGPIIPAAEEFGVDTTDTAGARQFVLSWFHDGNLNQFPGDMFTVRATAANTTGNLVWTASTITFDQTLPVGKYRVVGMDVVGTNLIAARILFPNGGMRPGVLARQALTTLPSNQTRFGKFGSFGEFSSTALPGVEFIGSAAPVTQQIWLDLQRI